MLILKKIPFLLFFIAVLSFVPSVASAQGNVVEKVLTRQRTKTLKDGSVYKGDMMLMRPHGKGKCTYTDGTVYQGQFEHGRRHGQGTMTYLNGEKYEGAWLKDVRTGHGIYH